MQIIVYFFQLIFSLFSMMKFVISSKYESIDSPTTYFDLIFLDWSIHIMVRVFLEISSSDSEKSKKGNNKSGRTHSNRDVDFQSFVSTDLDEWNCVIDSDWMKFVCVSPKYFKITFPFQNYGSYLNNIRSFISKEILNSS